jgi:predicted O-methyltransferase YrrM
MNYLAFLRAVHEHVSPQRYLEIGIRNGGSLALSQCRSVGIDPAFEITAELDGNFALFRTTSDEYFTRPDPLAPTGGQPFDLSFIDGLHLFEFALRDFINAERYSTPTSVVIFDDVLPRGVAEAARVRHTKAWTGDVYSILGVFERYRPELSVIPVGTAPTGLLVVVGLDPANTVLTDNYDEILAEFRRPDPQPVPAELLDRLVAMSPQRVLDAGFWSVLASMPDGAGPDQVRAALAPVLQNDLGAEFAAAV